MVLCTVTVNQKQYFSHISFDVFVSYSVNCCCFVYFWTDLHFLQDEDVTISANLESVYITNDTCLPPEAVYTGGITITSDDACSITVLPRLLIAPEGLPFEYSTTEWVSSHVIKFPKCKG